MNSRRKTLWPLMLNLVLVLVLFLAACSTTGEALPPTEAEEAAAEPAAEEAAEEADADAAEESAEPAEDAAMASGGLPDEIVVVEEPSAAAAVTRIESGDLDMYAFAVTDPDVFATVQSDSNLTYAQSYGSNSELTFNPAGPIFEGTGQIQRRIIAKSLLGLNPT